MGQSTRSASAAARIIYFDQVMTIKIQDICTGRDHLSVFLPVVYGEAMHATVNMLSMLISASWYSYQSREPHFRRVTGLLHQLFEFLVAIQSKLTPYIEADGRKDYQPRLYKFFNVKLSINFIMCTSQNIFT
uniref:Uncharacterized protein n=1 Tax=Solanum lycopersicum TaxID=4081 RepID=A0A3Q7J1Z4_SOLLC